MAAYFILMHTITDPQKYETEYIPGFLPFLAKYNIEVVVAEPETEPLQGDPAKGAVVLRFPSAQVIHDFLNDPDYQPLKELRLAITTNANAVLAPEFKWPEVPSTRDGGKDRRSGDRRSGTDRRHDDADK
jgi:uncharacterized protein (DUF1330 family)